MYIPLTFFSTQGSCFNVTTSTISGSGTVTTGSFISGGFYWDYWQFNNTADPLSSTQSFSASFNVLSGSTGQAKILIVGAGGGGGYNPGDSCINPYIDTLGSAGGGGGGGVVYYNDFPISSGSYEIVVGTAGVGGQSLPTPSRIGATGSVSYFKNKEFTYTPYNTSFLIAYGGGGGAGNTNNCTGNTYGHGTVGATYGGSSQTAIASTQVPSRPNPTYIGGNPAVIQGYGVGSIEGNPNGNNRVTGGGGAGGRAADVPGAGQNSAGSPGGDGIQYNVTGIPTYYGAGGGGVRFANTGLGTLSGNGTGWGNPGSGGTGGFGGRFGNIRGAEPGTNGVVIIAIPKCRTAFSCRQFAITGSGAVASFLECNNTFTTTSVTLTNGYDIVACLQTLSGSITPLVGTGATYRALSSSCDIPFTSSNDGCTNCNTYAVTSDSNKIAKVTYTPCNSTTSSITYVAGTYNLCVSSSAISVATGSASSLGTACSVLSCDATPSNDNTPTCPCQSLFVNVFNGIYRFTYTDCNGVDVIRNSSASPFCGVPGSIRNGSCIAGTCIGLTINQGGSCCTYP